MTEDFDFVADLELGFEGGNGFRVCGHVAGKSTLLNDGDVMFGLIKRQLRTHLDGRTRSQKLTGQAVDFTQLVVRFLCTQRTLPGGQHDRHQAGPRQQHCTILIGRWMSIMNRPPTPLRSRLRTEISASKQLSSTQGESGEGHLSHYSDGPLY